MQKRRNVCISVRRLLFSFIVHAKFLSSAHHLYGGLLLLDGRHVPIP
jgi:hypothetical protein